MSESKKRRPPLFSFDFNRSVKERSESPDITSNAGVLLLREIDHIPAITASIAKDISDTRNQDYIRYGISELLRERIYAIAAGYSRQDDADIVVCFLHGRNVGNFGEALVCHGGDCAQFAGQRCWRRLR